MKLANKVVVVTGALGGIGRETVRVMVEEGAKVVAADLNGDDLKTFSEQYDGRVVGVATDVRCYDDVEKLINTAVENFGSLDVIINNAGIANPKPLLDHDHAIDFDSVMAVNQKGVYFGILAAARKFVELGKPGVILNTSSVYGKMAAEMTLSYNVSKASVDMMTKCAALELAPHGIRVVAVAPGRVDTAMLRLYEAVGLWNHISKEQMRDKHTEPREIANVFAFLAADESNCINGTTIYADDGFTNFKFPLNPQI